jgi:hypothetical protein
MKDLIILRLADLDRAGKHRAVLFERADKDDLRRIQGFIQFGFLRLAGAGSFSSSYLSAEGNSLADLARYLRDYTPLKARIADALSYQYLWESEVQQFPIHFLFEDGGRPLKSSQLVTDFSEKDIKALGKYLDQGGFLFIEGGRRYLRDMVGHVRQAVDARGRLIDIPSDHPIYHSYYDYSDGFPGERGARNALHAEIGHNWYYPAAFSTHTEGYPMGLWGLELEGELSVVFSDIGLLSYWEPDVLFDDEEEQERLEKGPLLQAGTNIVIYALKRQQSMVVRRVRPFWQGLGGNLASKL